MLRRRWAMTQPYFDLWDVEAEAQLLARYDVFASRTRAIHTDLASPLRPPPRHAPLTHQRRPAASACKSGRLDAGAPRRAEPEARPSGFTRCGSCWGLRSCHHPAGRVPRAGVCSPMISNGTPSVSIAEAPRYQRIQESFLRPARSSRMGSLSIPERRQSFACYCPF